jgi:IS605 OrfB family transposase
VIRTHTIRCRIPREVADLLDLASGRIYTGVLVAHYRVWRRSDHWLSQWSAKRWDDYRATAPMHAHSIDAAQEGFYKACVTTHALRKAGFPEANFPYHRKKFRTTIWITCRQRRSESQGHAQRMANLQRALSRKVKGSKRYKRLVRAKVRMKAKHDRVMRDMEHKISQEIVNTAIAQQAGTIVIGDVRDIADRVDKGAKHNQKMSQWNHGKIRRYVQYKAAAEGIKVELVEEKYTTQTCPSCGHRHKPRGRQYECPSCGF